MSTCATGVTVTRAGGSVARQVSRPRSSARRRHLMRVEHQQDDVRTWRKPLQHLLVRVVAVDRLLAASEDAGSVDERAPARKVALHLAAGEAREKVLSELSKLAKRRARLRYESVAGQLPPAASIRRVETSQWGERSGRRALGATLRRTLPCRRGWLGSRRWWAPDRCASRESPGRGGIE